MKFIALLFFSSTVVGYSTCKKKKNTSAAPLSKTQLLEGKVWEVDELMHNVDCNNSHYIRGVKNTTDVNYDKMQFTFNQDGAGTHTDQYGERHRTTWRFNKKDERTIYLSVHLSSDINFTWHMVEITDVTVNATVSIVSGGENILESFRLTPVK